MAVELSLSHDYQRYKLFKNTTISFKGRVFGIILAIFAGTTFF